MKTVLNTVIGMMVLVFGSLAQAQMKPAEVTAAQSAFSANGCTSCHDASSRIVGPALKEIAARYKGKKVSTEVAKRIIEGSEGRWGNMPILRMRHLLRQMLRCSRAGYSPARPDSIKSSMENHQ